MWAVPLVLCETEVGGVDGQAYGQTLTDVVNGDGQAVETLGALVHRPWHLPLLCHTRCTESAVHRGEGGARCEHASCVAPLHSIRTAPSQATSPRCLAIRTNRISVVSAEGGTILVSCRAGEGWI